MSCFYSAISCVCIHAVSTILKLCADLFRNACHSIIINQSVNHLTTWQTPVFVARGVPLTESMVICQYLDEEYAHTPLMPDTPVARARARLAIEVCNFRLMPRFYAALALGPCPPLAVEQMLATLREIEGMLAEASPAGPYWFGAQFTIVDIAFFPFLDRCAVM